MYGLPSRWVYDQDGLRFAVYPDGSVRIQKTEERENFFGIVSDVIIPPGEWNKILASLVKARKELFGKVST